MAEIFLSFMRLYGVKSLRETEKMSFIISPFCMSCKKI